ASPTKPYGSGQFRNPLCDNTFLITTALVGHEDWNSTGCVAAANRRSGCANVWRDDVRLLKPKRVGDPRHELAHGAWRHQRLSAFGTPEPREIDRHQVRRFAEPRPDWFVREHTLWLWAEQ